MKIKLFLAALCLFLAPLCFTSSPQFSAYAGGWLIWTDKLIPCECDEPGCSGGDCDATITESATASSPSTSSNLGAESLLALAALMLWLRIKA